MIIHELKRKTKGPLGILRKSWIAGRNHDAVFHNVLVMTKVSTLFCDSRAMKGTVTLQTNCKGKNEMYSTSSTNVSLAI